jgi:hypothetical protein
MRTQQKRVSNAEVVNGVHPLHWATSPGPSPMGTDPINGYKMVQNVSGISEHQLQQQNRMLYKPSRLLSSGNYNSAFKRQRKLNHTECSRFTYKQQSGNTQINPLSVLCLGRNNFRCGTDGCIISLKDLLSQSYKSASKNSWKTKNAGRQLQIGLQKLVENQKRRETVD